MNQKLYIAVREDFPDFMTPTLVGHAVLRHSLEVKKMDQMFIDRYNNWETNSFKKCVVKVNLKEFEKIKAMPGVVQSWENNTLGGEVSCLTYVNEEKSIPNVLKFAKLWKPAAQPLTEQPAAPAKPIKQSAPQRIFLDTEFNGFGGEVISIAMVSEDDKEFYELVNYPTAAHPWVKEHVLPVIGDEMMPVFGSSLRSKLQAYLCQWDEVVIVADWAQDFEIFFNSIYQANYLISLPKLSTEYYRGPKDVSAIPHNALEDARALKSGYLTKTK